MNGKSFRILFICDSFDNDTERQLTIIYFILIFLWQIDILGW